MFGKQDKMDVRCNSELETNRLSKNGHKEGKESKSSEGNISNSFLKEPQGTFSASGVSEDCSKNKSSSADPDYCRRILVRGRTVALRSEILINDFFPLACFLSFRFYFRFLFFVFLVSKPNELLWFPKGFASLFLSLSSCS